MNVRAIYPDDATPEEILLIEQLVEAEGEAGRDGDNDEHWWEAGW